MSNKKSFYGKYKKQINVSMAGVMALVLGVSGYLLLNSDGAVQEGGKTAEAGSLGGNTGIGYGYCGYGGDCDTGIGGQFSFDSSNTSGRGDKTNPLLFKNTEDLEVTFNGLMVNYDDTINTVDGTGNPSGVADDYRCEIRARVMNSTGAYTLLEDGATNTEIAYDSASDAGCSAILTKAQRQNNLNWDFEVTVYDYSSGSQVTVGTAREGYAFTFAGFGA